MIGLSKNGKFLDLFPNTTLTVEQDSPLFATDAIPGLKVYNFDIPKSKHNIRELGFPSGLSNSVPDSQYLDKIMLHVGNNGLLPYKQGTLKFKGSDDERISYSFQSGAGEVAMQLKDKKLNQIPLGSYESEYQYNAIYPDKNHTYCTIFNEDRLGREDGTNSQYINEFTGGNISTVTGPLIPFPFLCYIVERVFNHFGFINVTGTWFEDERIRRIVIFSNYSPFVKLYTEHMPDMTVGDFLISIKNMFALCITFDSASSTVRLDWKKDFITTKASNDMTRSAAPKLKYFPSGIDGFTLNMTPDSNDKLTDASPIPFTYQVGNGKDPINTSASSFYAEKHLNIFLKIRQAMGDWFPTGKKPVGLRLMFYTGQQIFLGKSYPTGDYEYGGLSLAWEGENGLYNQCHKPWLDFLSDTYLMDRTMNFNLLDLMQLDLTQKAMIQYNKFLFSKVRFTATTGKQKIFPASTTMYRSKY